MFKVNYILKRCVKVNTINNYFFKRYAYKKQHNVAYNSKIEDIITNNDKQINIKQMNSSVLCIFSNMLLKENIKNDFIWKKIEVRSYEIIDNFEVSEIASFLFCLSKIRYETNLYESFIPIIKKKCEYLNTSNLAMLISTYSKRKNEELIKLLKEELKKKVHTLNNIVEISMILNALVKCRLYDESLFIKLDNIIINNIIYNNVHVRDICVIVYCYAYILYKNMNIFKILSQKIILLIDYINIIDFCRILYAYMKINKNFNHILKFVTYKLKNVVDKSSINEMINCIHFLPILKEIVEKHGEGSDISTCHSKSDSSHHVSTKYNGINYNGINYNGINYNGINYSGINYSGINYTDTNYTKIEEAKDVTFNYTIDYTTLFNYIVNIFNNNFTIYINLLNANQLSNILYIYSRYNIQICLPKLEIFISQIMNMTITNQLKIYILYSLSIMLKNYENNFIYNFDFFDVNKIFIKNNTEIIKNETFKKNNMKSLSENDYEQLKNNLLNCFKCWEKGILIFINDYTVCQFQDIIKVLHIFFILKNTYNSVINSIKTYVIFNYKNITKYNAYTLMFYFKKLKILTVDEDLSEILQLKIRSLK
ncbi:conserved protein, unknown function [Hepatocystis sp. ex Piliocolobus tephrosceles]|nr:conserved protein, unknown function [Hepatocystis sp. ex Piliocolobus tephrosceles]